MIVIGLMSGTSMDGVDAVACRIEGKGRHPRVTPLAAVHLPYPAKLRRRIGAVAGADGRADELCRLNVEIGALFGKAARQAMALLPADRPATLVASHGQTVRHLPAEGATLQIGDPAVIAQVTGLPVWSQFRSADMARGGQGAPLAPVAHRLLFGGAENTLVVNLGGMANVSWIPAGADDLAAVVGYDIGPGMRLVDMATQKAIGRPFDRDGWLARKGNVVASHLLSLLAHPYYRKRPPKSTGRELFNERYLADAGIDLARADADLVATLTELTASVVGKEGKRVVQIITFGAMKGHYPLPVSGRSTAIRR
ncbi:MAG: anhydro-N-acetylmuramic acid kinase, partial [Nitrospinae bacterium]|nr:anhydro-N-acetylmuramic acid kinase [Nitrospinota bacterium]